MKNILLTIFILIIEFQVVAQEKERIDDNRVYTFVSQKASPKEGIQIFYKSFINEFQQPKLPAEINEIGVKLKFVVEKDGSFTDIQIIEDKFDVDKEATRVLKTMPKWNPAKHNGKIVRSAFTLPIKLRVDNQQKEEPESKFPTSFIETEYFELKCNDCSVRTGIDKTDYRIESKDKTTEYQVTLMKIPEELGNEFLELVKSGGQDPNAVVKEISFLDNTATQVDFFSEGLKCPYNRMIAFYKNGYFISISAASYKPELADKLIEELKQTFKLKI